MKEKSEKHILQRLVEEVNELNRKVGLLHEIECAKSNLNRKIAEGIRKNGMGFEKNLQQYKNKAMKVIKNQNETIFSMRKTITKIHHLLTLLINLEQASLAIHNNLKRDELSELIDSENMPLNKFRVELDHVDTLKANLDILLVELAKQEEYIKNFSLESANIDENNFYQSERYISIISTSGIGSVWELKNFCKGMDELIKKRLKYKKENVKESDRVAYDLMQELKEIKIKSGLFFSFTIYDFVNKVVSQNMTSNNLRKLVAFLIFFLLSRLKKFDEASYYSQLRATVMVYALLHKNNVTEKRKNIITGACLLRKIEELNLPKIENETDFKEELGIVRKYYKTVNMFFDHEFPFIKKVLVVFQKKREEYETPLDWVENGARLIRVAYEVDKKLNHHSFDKENIEKNRESIYDSIAKRHKKNSDDISFLLKNWDRIIPRKIRIKG